MVDFVSVLPHFFIAGLRYRTHIPTFECELFGTETALVFHEIL